MDTRIQKLRTLNIFAGALHLASLIAILALSTDVSLPVRATYLSEAPGTGNFSDRYVARTGSDTSVESARIAISDVRWSTPAKILSVRSF
ncbi:MAG: hypothetical protein ACKOYI_10665 [Actinomycetota bacterium]